MALSLWSWNAVVLLGTATVQGVDLARTSFDENELEKLSTANLNKPITMRVTDEERSPYGAVVLQPRESRIVRAECDGELAFVLFQVQCSLVLSSYRMAIHQNLLIRYNDIEWFYIILAQLYVN